MKYICVCICNKITDIRILTKKTFLHVIKSSSSFFSSFYLESKFNTEKNNHSTYIHNDCDWGWFIEIDDDYKKNNL